MKKIGLTSLTILCLLSTAFLIGSAFKVGKVEACIHKDPRDSTSPTISILSPEHKTYTTRNVPLTFTVSESVSWIGYGLDGQQNQTIIGNTTLSNLSDGLHILIVYANDTAGNMGTSEIVLFIIETQKGETQRAVPFPIEIVAVIVIVIMGAVGAVAFVYFKKFRK